MQKITIMMEYLLLEREGYSDRIRRMFGRKMVIALTGQRRVGKSYTMKAVIEDKRHDSNANIIYIDKERTEFDDIVTYKDLESYIKSRLSVDKENYLFIDEVQEIEDFEKTILDLQASGKCEIMLTGMEFLRFHDLTDSDDTLGLYLQNGGLPGLRLMGLDNPDLVRDYMMNVYNTILLRDIIEREKIRNIPLLKTLVRFLSDNIGKQFSARSISNFLKAQRTDASTNIILSYLEYLCNAYIVDRVERYNIHGKRLLEFDDKFYFEDLGIRNTIIGGNRQFDIEKVMENVVYKHLARLGYTVYVGQLQKAEIDFVAEKQDGRIYVQVTYLLATEDTVKREFGNLNLIRDNHPKYVVSMDRIYGMTNIDGIKHVHLREFLKMENF